ncbi:unnamed protein product, partial [Iphiclides podalirius]
AAAARSLCWCTSRLLVGHDDGVLYMWAVQRCALIMRLLPCDGALHALTTLARGSMLLVACTSGTLKIFDFDDIFSHDASGKELPPPLLWEDGAHDLGALCAATIEGGEVAASGGHDGHVRLWRVAPVPGRKRGVVAAGVLCGHTAAVTALCWSRGAAGELLASASLDRTARLWVPLTLTCLRVLHAHSRYLTSVALSHDLRFMLTGSNDRSVRTWAIGNFTLDDDIEPPCLVLSHFGLGDLAGIEPCEHIEDFYEEDLKSEEAIGRDDGYNGAERVWILKDAQVGAINSIAIHKDLLATACSDGSVRVFRWSERLQMLSCERILAAHRYPAVAVDIGAGGALLLSAGLDGRARLWDLQSGCELLSLSGESLCGGEAGGGGVRGACISTHRPPLLLLATDDGALALWSVVQRSSEPLHVYEPFAEAATCCAWTSDGRLCVVGGVGGELRLLAPPPTPSTLRVHSAAHDLGVLSCDFAPLENGIDTNSYMLASAGRDALVKLWRVLLENDSSGEARVSICLLWGVEAHGGAVESVRWGSGVEGARRLATSGADGWARAWLVSAEGRARAVAAVPADEGTGASAASLLGEQLLATGSLAGELALWRLPTIECQYDGEDSDEIVEPRHWRITGVLRWLREYVTRTPEFRLNSSGVCRTLGAPVSPACERLLVQRARDAQLSGRRLLDEPLDGLLELLLPRVETIEEVLNESEIENTDENKEQNNLAIKLKQNPEVDLAFVAEVNDLRTRLHDEIQWLRRDLPSFELEYGAPHSLRCPLTHALLKEPARAADGFSYERANIIDYFFAVDGAVSPMNGRRMQSALVAPNIGLRQQLREYLAAGVPLHSQ